VRTFVDTNVLVYAYDRAEDMKRQSALHVLREVAPTDLVLSSQVLSEFYVATTRPSRPLLTKDRAREVVTSMSWTTVEVVDSDLVRRALRIHRNHPLSYWDSLIVAAATRAECGRILTEDFSSTSPIEGVQIQNPFLAEVG
jgi:predicted nucleic acid-binding protein